MGNRVVAVDYYNLWGCGSGSGIVLQTLLASSTLASSTMPKTLVQLQHSRVKSPRVSEAGSRWRLLVHLRSSLSWYDSLNGRDTHSQLPKTLDGAVARGNVARALGANAGLTEWLCTSLPN